MTVERIFNAMVANMVANGYEIFWQNFMMVVTDSGHLKHRAFVRFTKNGNSVEFSSQDVYSEKEMEEKIAKFYERVEYLKENGYLS